jgi:hypothetical protein
MSLAYPIARSLEEATLPGAKIARTQREAASLVPGMKVEGLETSWLHLTEAEATALLAAQGAEGPAGHIQRYEDTSGHVVVAVSWWKLVDPKLAKKAKAPPPPADETQKAKSDHTMISISAVGAPSRNAASTWTPTSSTCSRGPGTAERLHFPPLRYFPGLVPVQRRNAREKADGSEKPVR